MYRLQNLSGDSGKASRGCITFVTDKISINGLRISTIIGIEPEERRAPQDIWVDLEFIVAFDHAVSRDQITDTIDYHTVCDRIAEFVQASNFRLIETLVERIADFLLQQFSFSWVKLKLTKKPFDMPDVNSVSIVIERNRP